ncbi:RlpA-like double-psi beta-barrel-protein domain-containing protein-containing protein [Choanephora cucurbitarum]|nr:RlpA-like double-psi beta-barrel-protein domain-containing protein-containing protein [Choanephora cucurbitarum]
MMNKLLLIICFAFLCLFSQTESRPLNLSKTAKNLLSILGRATFYDVSAGLGSCGRQSKNSDMVVAVNHLQMDNGANPNTNPHCGRKVKIVGNTGKPVVAEIVDTCPGCSSGCLDMSSSLFERVCGELSMGICPIKWDFV